MYFLRRPVNRAPPALVDGRRTQTTPIYEEFQERVYR